MTRDFGSRWPSVDLLGLLFYSGLISIAIVTVITVTAQDTPVENPRRKTCFMRHRNKPIYPRERWQCPKPRTLDWISLQTRPFQWKITSWVCQEDLHTQLECLETTYFQDNSCLHSIPGAKVSASLRGHPLHLLRAELAGGCLGVGPSCCEGPEIRKPSQLACLRSVARCGKWERSQLCQSCRQTLPAPRIL